MPAPPYPPVTDTHTRLDAWLPQPAIRTHHRRSAAAAPAEAWARARGTRLSDTRTLGRLVRWRIPGTPPGATFDGLLRAYPFTVLDEGEEHLISGLCGRIWTLQRDYPRLAGPDEFRSWDERGTVRVLFGNWIEPDRDGRVTLVSEARVEPVDRAARVRLRALWAVIGRFEQLVGAEALSAAARRAEGR
jgi:hypothetical protein